MGVDETELRMVVPEEDMMDPDAAAPQEAATEAGIEGPKERELGEIARDECSYEVDVSSSEEETLAMEAPATRPRWKEGALVRQSRQPPEAHDEGTRDPRSKTQEEMALDLQHQIDKHFKKSRL